MNSDQGNPVSEPSVQMDGVQSAAKPCDNNTQAKLLEESAKKALALKKKELQWKLMQVSQAKNQAKLRETQTAVTYHRDKLTKALELATRLRKKYLKVVKSARMTELQLKKAEAQQSQQERFVAHEKMQLTKLAFDCINSGAELFGDKYALPQNSNNRYRINIPKRLVSATKQRSPAQLRLQMVQKLRQSTTTTTAATTKTDTDTTAAAGPTGPVDEPDSGASRATAATENKPEPKRRILKLNMLGKLPPILIDTQKSKWASGIPTALPTLNKTPKNLKRKKPEQVEDG